jgi:hypothetical protein
VNFGLVEGTQPPQVAIVTLKLFFMVVGRLGWLVGSHSSSIDGFEEYKDNDGVGNEIEEYVKDDRYAAPAL